jgi:hypothetical protein
MATFIVAPGGGGDFVDLATADAAIDPGDTLLCRSGGDLGGFDIQNAALIDADEGHAHDGTIGDINAVAAISGDFVFCTVSRANTTVRRLRISTWFGALSAQADGVTIERVLLTGNENGANSGLQGYGATGATYTITFRNNVIYDGSLSVACIVSGAATGTLNAIVENNTCIGDGTTATGIVWTAETNNAGGTSTLNLTMRNNYSSGSDGATWNDYNQTSQGAGTETFNLTLANNASGDGTANDFGGTGHLVDQVDAEWFVDPATNLALKAGSPGIDAGVTIAGATADVIGTARPQGAAYDIGAFERQQSAAGGARRVARLRFGRFGGQGLRT